MKRDAKITTKKIEMQNYDIYEFCREEMGGGVLLGVLKEFNISRLTFKYKCEHVMCKLHNGKKKQKDFIIGSVYLPNSPNSDNIDLKEFVKMLNDLNKNNTNFSIIGDMNCWHKAWSCKKIIKEVIFCMMR